PQLRDVDLQRFLRRRGRLLLPKRVDQTVAGHDAVRLQQEECQQRALLLPTKIERQPVRSHLERAQEIELMTDPDDATPGIARTRRRRRPLGAAPSPGTGTTTYD